MPESENAVTFCFVVAFGAVLREYSSDRGHATIDNITIEEIGLLGSGGDTFYERGFTVFEGEKLRQKNK